MFSIFQSNIRLHETVITPEGDVFCWTDKMECSLFTIYGRGLKMSDIPSDALYDALKTVPPRPTISNLHWIMGTQYLGPNDLNLLSIPNLRAFLIKQLAVQIGLSPNLKLQHSMHRIDNVRLLIVPPSDRILRHHKTPKHRRKEYLLK